MLSGCAMCANCDDYAYPAFGGKWQRADRFHGRVGSVFDPAEIRPAAEEIAPGSVGDDQDGDSQSMMELPEMTEPLPYGPQEDPPPVDPSLDGDDPAGSDATTDL
jgi:hypothetical protein